MNKIISYSPGEHCAKLYDALTYYFQRIDDQMSTEELVEEFVYWLDSNNLTLSGKKVMFDVDDTSEITQEEIQEFHTAFLNSPIEPITLVVPPTFKIRFEPACEHLLRYNESNEE